MTPDLDEQGREIARLVRRMKLILRKTHPGVQGAALAEMTATWLSGFVYETDRREVFAHHLQGIWDMLETILKDMADEDEAEAKERLH